MSYNNNIVENFTMFTKQTRMTSLEEKTTCDKALADVSNLAVSAGQDMTGEFAKGNMQGGAYLAETASALNLAIQAASNFTKHVVSTNFEKENQNNTSDAPSTSIRAGR